MSLLKEGFADLFGNKTNVHLKYFYFLVRNIYEHV